MKIFKAIWNVIRGADAAAAKAMKNNVRDAKLKIEDAKKKVAQFEQNISQHISARLELERKVKTEKANLKKWNIVKENAGKNQDIETARSALTKIAGIKSQIAQLEASIKSNKAMADKFIAQRDKLNQRIQTSESNLSTLAAREKSANMNIEMNKAASKLQGGFDLGLDEFEDEVVQKENDAAAWDELSHDPDSDMLEKYGETGSSDIEAELAALMDKHKK